MSDILKQRVSLSVASHDDSLVDKSFVNLSHLVSSRASLSLSELEDKLLKLYDQLDELCLEHVVLECQLNFDQDVTTMLSNDEAESLVKEAERECLESRAAYILKKSIVENVISVDPLLKAIHAGAGGDPLEKLLHPQLDKRDVLSMIEANLAASLRTVINNVTLNEHENIMAMRRNQELAAVLLALTDQIKNQEVISMENDDLRDQMKTVKIDTKEAKRRWRIMKSVIAAVIAGSGVDWARDRDLQDLVLDDEDN